MTPMSHNHDLLRELQSEKFQARCLPALADAFALALTRIVRRPHELKHRGQKLGKGPLINAIVAHFVAQPVEEQARIAREGIRIYERMVDEAAGVPGPLEASDSHGRPGADVAPERPVPRRRSAGR